VEPGTSVSVVNDIINVNIVVAVDADGDGAGGGLGVRAIPAGGHGGVGEDVVTTLVASAGSEVRRHLVGRVGDIGGIRLTLRPVVPLVLVIEVTRDLTVRVVGDVADIPVTVVVQIVQVEELVPVIGRQVSGGLEGDTDGDNTIVADPVSSLGEGVVAVSIGERRVPVIPSVLVLVGPRVRVVDGDLATVLVVVVEIEARERVADDVAPSQSLVVGTGADDLSVANVDEANGAEQVVVLRLLREVVGVESQALRLEVGSGVGTREVAAIDALLTARGKVHITLLTTGNGATARTREVSLAAVRRIEIVVVPTTLADIAAKTGGAVADVVLETTGVGRDVDVVDEAEGVEAVAITLTVVAVSSADVAIHWSTVTDITVDEVSGVEERAIEGTLVEGGNVSLERETVSLEDLIESLVSLAETSRTNIGEVSGDVQGGVGHGAVVVLGVTRERGEVLVEPSAGDGELETRRTGIAVLARLGDEVVSGVVRAGRIARGEVVDRVEEIVIDGTHDIRATVGVTATLLATVGPVHITIDAHVLVVAVGIAEVNVTSVERRRVSRDGTAGILNRVVVLLSRENGDLTSQLLNERAVGLSSTNTEAAGAKGARESTAINAKISTAAGGGGDVN